MQIANIPACPSRLSESGKSAGNTGIFWFQRWINRKGCYLKLESNRYCVSSNPNYHTTTFVQFVHFRRVYFYVWCDTSGGKLFNISAVVFWNNLGICNLMLRHSLIKSAVSMQLSCICLYGHGRFDNGYVNQNLISYCNFNTFFNTQLVRHKKLVN